ncbi:hypothetical protein PHISCL_04478 [Aspergillus sclerotialis]|uniref:Uncharacterized protein n=1 Tax=Aspergillus sclerotialis TaxID=2070753 RepID=A0A3A3A1H5_9EURO|nr:hypothetical protein PHISCL_04478 [Aspergillus sclerotialis]
MTTHYEVFLTKFHLTIQDPDTPGPRHHTTIFVQTSSDGSGILHQVTGDITSPAGMSYTPTPSTAPEQSETFHSSQRLGTTPASTHPDEWYRLLENVPAPPQQKAFNVKTMKTEPFKMKDPLTFYEPGELRRPLVKCTEWTLEKALPALRENKLIIEG